MPSKEFSILFSSKVDPSGAEKNIQQIQKMFEKTKLEVKPTYNSSVFRQISKNLHEITDEATQLKTLTSSFTSGGIKYDITQQQAISKSGYKYFHNPQISYSTELDAAVAQQKVLAQQSKSQAVEVENDYKRLLAVLKEYKQAQLDATKAEVSGSQQTQDLVKARLSDYEAEIDKIQEKYKEQEKFDKAIEKAKKDSAISVSKTKDTISNKDDVKNLSRLNQQLKIRYDLQNDIINVERLLNDVRHKSNEELKGLLTSLNKQKEAYNEKIQQTKELIKGEEAQEKATEAISQANERLEHDVTIANAKLKDQGTWFDDLTQSIKNYIHGAVTLNLVSAAFDKLSEAVREGIEVVKELDKAMTDIQMVTGDTDEGTAKLATEYSQLAQELGSTTAQIAAGASEWLRQGRSIADTSMLLRQSMILSKVGALESSEATQQLTAVINGYQMQAEEASHVVDALSAVDLAAATSTRELSTALQYTANSARTSGVEFDYLVGMIGAVSEATRLSESIIGNAFKTLFARLTNVAAGKAIDEEGESLNDVETTLNRMGIRLRDSIGTWRNMGEVIAEVASKWEKFTDVQRSQIATAIAGTRQREIFLSLMENWDRVQELTAVAANSAGSSAEKFEVYLDSIESKTNQLKAAFEELVYSPATQNLFKILIDGATLFIKLLDKIIDPKFGFAALAGLIVALAPKVMGLATAFKVFAMDAVFSVGSVTGALKVMGTTLLSNPIFAGVAVAASIFALIQAIEVLSDTTEKWKSKLENLSQEYESVNNKMAENRSEIERLNSKEVLTDDEEYYLELLKAQNEELDRQAKLLKQEEYEASAKVRSGEGAQLVQTGFARSGVDGPVPAYEYVSGLDALVNRYNELNDALDTADTVEKQKELRAELADVRLQLINNATAIKEYEIAGVDLTNAEEEFLKTFDRLGIVADDVSSSIDGSTSSVEELDSALQEIDDNSQTIAEIFTNLKDGLLTLEDVKAEVTDTGIISIDTLNEILEKFPQMSEAVNMYLLGLASTEDVMAALQEAYSVDEQNAYNNIIAKLKMNDEYYTYLKQLDAQLVDEFAKNYGIGIDNHLSYNEGKARIEEYYVNEFNRIWAEHFGKTAEGFEDMGEAIGALDGLGEGAISQHVDIDRLRSLANKYKSAMEDWKGVYDNSFVISLTNQYTALGNSAKEAAKSARSASSEASKAQREYEKQQNDLLELTVKMLRKKKELEKEALQDQLEGYKKLIDAQQQLLDKQDEEYKHNRELDERNKSISRLESQIAELQFDTSAEGVKRRLLLEEQLAEERRELEDYQHDYSIDQQKDALDEEEKRFEDQINNSIDEIDRYLSQTGLIYAEAMRLIDEHADATLQDLLWYNSVYGDSINQWIIDAWNGATSAVYAYESALNSAAQAAARLSSTSGGGGYVAPSVGGGSPNKALITSNPGNKNSIGKGIGRSHTKITKRHKGIDAGLIGGNLKGNEQFVKALKGEAFVTKEQQDRFMQKILPDMFKTAQPKGTFGNLSFEKLIDITVQGNLDKTVLPDIESIIRRCIKEINNTMFRSGFNKSTTSVAI